MFEITLPIRFILVHNTNKLQNEKHAGKSFCKVSTAGEPAKIKQQNPVERLQMMQRNLHFMQ